MDFLTRINLDLFQEGLEILEGDSTEAINVLKKRIDENPDESILWSLMGEAYQNIGEKLKALDCYEKAIELEPQNYLAWKKKGLLIEDLNEAIKCLDKSLELNEDPEVWFFKGAYTQT